MEAKEIRSLVELAGKGPRRLFAVLVDFRRSTPTTWDPTISIGDILDDVESSADDVNLPARGSMGDESWSSLWAFVRPLPASRFYGVAIAVVSLLLTVSVGLAIWRGEPVPTPIFAGAMTGWLVLPVVRSVHRPTTDFTFVEALLLWLAITLMATCGGIELHRQLVDLSLVESASLDRRLALGIPIGMIELAIVLAAVALFGTTGSRRRLAIPGWVSIGVGCVATFVHTGAENNLLLAMCCAVAATIAVRRST